MTNFIDSVANYFDEHLPKRLLMALVGASFFFLMSVLVPDLYFHYLDHTQYIQITQPVSMDKDQYQPCEKTILTTTLTALIDTPVHSITQLVLIKEGSGVERINGSIHEGTIPVRQLGPHLISGSMNLPCNVSPGNYLWQGVATYQIHGYDRNISFTTSTFRVALKPDTDSP